MSVEQAQYEKIFKQGHSFVDFLSAIDYTQGAYILADGSLGKIWNIALISCEGKNEQFLEALSRNIEQLITRLPEGQLACQFILKVSDDTYARQEMYSHYQEESSLNNLFLNSKLARLAKESRNIDLLMTVRFFPQWPTKKWWGKRLLVEDRMDFACEEFERITKHIESILILTQFQWNEVLKEELITWLYHVLNPRRSKHIRSFPIHNDMPIRDQVLFNEPHVNGFGFEFEDKNMRIVSLKELPGITLPGMLTRELNEGLKCCILDSAPKMMLVINMSVPPLSESMNRLNWHKSFAFMHQENWLGDKSIEVIEKKKELDETISRIYRDGERIANIRIHVVITADSKEECEAGSDRLMGAFSRLQCDSFVESMIGASLFLSCLPLGFDPYYERFIKRVKRLASPNASDMLPFYGSFEGTRTPACCYLNRRNQFVWVDFFDSNINPHALVVGASGAGKSFFMNDFILQNERLGAHFFILDKGDSYIKINRILNGQYVRFDLNNPITINPFSYDPNPENLSFLLSLLSQMASGCDERDRLSREEEGLLQKAVGYAYQTINHEIILSDLVEILNNNSFNEQFGINSLMGPTLALRLTPFTKRGPYGGFFDGPNQFTIHSRFSVFEMGNLSAYADLQVVILLNLMFFMTNFVSSSQMRPLRKYLLIDEAWSLLRVKNTADFIANAYKTFRKYRCCVTAITQELSDLTRQESGMAIIANASNKVFLKQEASMIDLLKDKLSLDDAIIESLKTLVMVKGHFSEAFIIAEEKKGIVRLYSDPVLYWAANSETRNNDYLSSKAKTMGGDLYRALEACAKEFPNGLS